MRVIDPGHIYELDSVDGNVSNVLQFVKRVGARYPGNVGAYAGTQVQEVLRACINRLEFVNAQAYSIWTVRACHALRTALWFLEIRHAFIKGWRMHAGVNDIEAVPTCKQCGHIECQEHVA